MLDRVLRLEMLSSTSLLPKRSNTAHSCELQAPSLPFYAYEVLVKACFLLSYLGFKVIRM